MLGGTVFVGRAIAENARDRGHEVTVFHRGTKGPGQVAGVHEIFGDRDGGLDALGDQTWDVVIDTCGYVPRVVGASAEVLRDRTSWYGFISTISIYEEHDGELREPQGAAPDTEEVTGPTYGPLKYACEATVQEIFGARCGIFRPGLIAGPHDPTYRFPYWVDRAQSGLPFLLPEVADSSLQQVDARDLAALVVTSAEERRSVVVDVVGERSTFGQTLDLVLSQHPGAQPRRVSEAWLAEQGVALWQDLPLALPTEGSGTMMQISGEQALALGLVRRPFSQTAADVATWLRENPVVGPTRYGMSREREAELQKLLA